MFYPPWILLLKAQLGSHKYIITHNIRDVYHYKYEEVFGTSSHYVLYLSSSSLLGAAENYSRGSSYPDQVSQTVSSSELSSSKSAFAASAGLRKSTKQIDPSMDLLSSPSNLRNWLPDSGITKHMTSCLANLEDVEEGLDLGVEVADDHIIHSTTQEKVRLQIMDDNGLPLKTVLTGTLYVPGLCCWLFSVTTFAQHGHSAMIHHNVICFFFSASEYPVTIPLAHGMPLASDAKVASTKSVPQSQCRNKSS